MIIIHYTLGFPPLRSGGLTKYALDLMKEQANLGHKVIAMIPRMNVFSFQKGVKITKVQCDYGLDCYALYSAIPIPLLYGVKSPEDYICYNKGNKVLIQSFLSMIKPDVIHIHTLMGLPMEFLETAKEQGIRTIFTTHDYYGLCPKVNFIDQKRVLCLEPNETKCSLCNTHSLPRWLLWLRNSKLMVLLKKC